MEWLARYVMAIIKWILDRLYERRSAKKKESAELREFYCSIQVLVNFSRKFIPELIVTVNKMLDDEFGDKNDDKILIPPRVTIEGLTSSLQKVSMQLTAEQHGGVNALKEIVRKYSLKLEVIEKAETRDFSNALNCLNALLALYYTSSRMFEQKERFFLDVIKPDELRDKVLLAFRYKIQSDKRPFIART